jgi:hypothetical protein
VSSGFEPKPLGSLASKARGHTHVMRIIAWSIEGPLKALMSCAYCSKTETVRPSKRIRKIPAGFTPTTWAKFLEKGEERLEALKAQEKAAA